MANNKNIKKLSKNSKSIYKISDKDTRENIVLRKSNRMVEARYYLPLWELRLYQELIEHINQGTDQDGKLFIHLREFAERYSTVNGRLFHTIRAASIKLGQRMVMIEMEDPSGQGDNRMRFLPLLSEANVPASDFPNGDRHSYVVLHLNPRLRNEFIELTQNYTSYNAEMTRKLSSTYSIRIYEILVRYRFMGQVRLSFDDLREMVGALAYDHSSDQPIRDFYGTYASFNRDVLAPAKESIEAFTDTRFEYAPVYEHVPVKSGRIPVVGIHFYNIRSTDAKQTQRQQLQEPPVHDIQHEVVDAPPTGKPKTVKSTPELPPQVDLFGQQTSSRPKTRKKKVVSPTPPAPETVAVSPVAKEPVTPQTNDDLMELGKKLGMSEFYLKTSFVGYTRTKIEAALMVLQRKLESPGERAVENVNGYFNALLKAPDLESQYFAEQERRQQESQKVEKQRELAKGKADLKKELDKLKVQYESNMKRLYHEQERVIKELFESDDDFHITVFSRVNAIEQANGILEKLMKISVDPRSIYSRSEVFYYFYEVAFQLRPDDQAFSGVVQMKTALNNLGQRIDELSALMSK